MLAPASHVTPGRGCTEPQYLLTNAHIRHGIDLLTVMSFQAFGIAQGFRSAGRRRTPLAARQPRHARGPGPSGRLGTSPIVDYMSRVSLAWTPPGTDIRVLSGGYARAFPRMR